MRLSEFYDLREEHDRYYTISEDRLLEWDHALVSELEEASFEVIAQGSFGNLIEELQKRMPLASEDIDKIEYGVSMGCSVTVLREGNEITVRM